MSEIHGLHHVTCIAGDAQENVDFYAGILGMHLVKRSVNQDDPGTYHLFYADAEGSPGTDLTFFDWPDIGPHRPGVGTISRISLGVPVRDAPAWWAKRFEDLHIVHDGIQTRGEAQSLVLPFRDPEGQRLELVDDGGKLAGTGLGLAISRQIVEALHGQISAENRRDAGGRAVAGTLTGGDAAPQ